MLELGKDLNLLLSPVICVKPPLPCATILGVTEASAVEIAGQPRARARASAKHHGHDVLGRPGLSVQVPTLSLKAMLPVKLLSPFCPPFLPILLSSLHLRPWLPWSLPSVPAGRALVPSHRWLVSCSEQGTPHTEWNHVPREKQL